MTKRSRDTPSGVGPRGEGGRGSLSKSEYPALRALFGGYLHEDFVAEHGTADQAVRSFFEAADRAERERLVAEWHAFTTRTADWPWRSVRRAVRELGAAWAPPSRAALLALVDTDT